MKRLASFLICVFALTLSAQTPLTADGLAALTPAASSGGGGVSWALVSSSSSTTYAADDATSEGSPLNATGANLLIAAVASTGGSPTFTDTSHNTWTLATGQLSNNPRLTFAYCINPTVTSGMVFTNTVPGGNSLPFHIYAFAKTGGTPTLDSEATPTISGNWNSQSLTASSQTPSTPNNLFLAAVDWDVDPASPQTISVDSSFLTPQNRILLAITGVYGIHSGYKIKSADSTAEQPGWTRNSAQPSDASVIAITFQ